MNFAPIFSPDCLGSLICGLYYIEESVFGTSWKPKYSTVEEFDREHFVLKPICRARLLAD